MGGLSDLLNSHIIERWWGTINKRSKAEVDFKRSITDKNRIPSTRIQAKLFKASSPNIGICQTPKELLYHPWVESIDPSPEAKQSDLCIVLEDMSLEWVEILGPLLSIPVSVFALHWANPIDHVGGDIRVPIGESPARHFILNYRQSLPFSILERSNDQNLEYRLDCNVVRPITSRSKDYEGIETSDQLVSFYATGLTRSGPSSKSQYLTRRLAENYAHKRLYSPSRRSSFNVAEQRNSSCFFRFTRRKARGEICKMYSPGLPSSIASE